VVRYGFKERGLRPIRANRFGSNAASERVLGKVGMVYQGALPDYYEKWGEKEDRAEYLLHARDWHRSSDR
jgi:RimJ/RimL family protein N-acetyltransferase